MNLFKDNLFSANHRNAMIQKHGYTAAMTVTVGLLEKVWRIAGIETLIEPEDLSGHDCKLSLKGYCQCQMLRS